MSDNLEYEIERYLATCIASDDPDAGYMAGNVVEMCREAIAAEIETAGEAAQVEYDKCYAFHALSPMKCSRLTESRFFARLVRRGEPS